MLLLEAYSVSATAFLTSRIYFCILISLIN